MKKSNIYPLIREAAGKVGVTWPLYSFVTSNPLSGYESKPFPEAMREAGRILGAEVFPSVAAYRAAFQKGEIARKIIKSLLKKHGFPEAPEFYLNELESGPRQHPINIHHDLDRIMAKWLAAFLDEGLAEWTMPRRDLGFYAAWRRLAVYDREIKGIASESIPPTAEEGIHKVLEDYPGSAHAEIITSHLASLAGWTGYIKCRDQRKSPWQQAYPIGLEDYLGVRLWIARALNHPVLSFQSHKISKDSHHTLKHLWLLAWEKTWQHNLLKTLSDKQESNDKQESTPDAQLVFCIDTRSEPMRRHVEAKGNYETFGYAGFFGIAMDYVDPVTDLVGKSCPPILSSTYRVSESAGENRSTEYGQFLQRKEEVTFREYFLKRMKNMLPSTFGFVEGTGLSYLATAILQTLFPRKNYQRLRNATLSYEAICQPDIRKNQEIRANGPMQTLSPEEQAEIVMSAFKLTGWKTFAPLVIFVGHGSATVNNPFGSSLDCGACAARPGRHNARMLARIANQKEIRKVLLREHGLIIPNHTHFLAAEHNTTTDEIIIFDSEIPDSHTTLLSLLKKDLDRAQKAATAEKLNKNEKSIAAAETKAGDWAETRPEWGLARNAGFIVASRNLTLEKDLGGRCFLHSYEWKRDSGGEALESIMQGPMVVTQWINNHYYFASVDPERFGSGSKITHNITGQFGVLQGNGGDLKFGLPLQSLQLSDTEAYHQPLRLSVLIQAPKKRVSEILTRNEHLRQLISNGWIHLLVLDPLEGNRAYHYLDLEPLPYEWSIGGILPNEREPAKEGVPTPINQVVHD